MHHTYTAAIALNTINFDLPKKQVIRPITSPIKMAKTEMTTVVPKPSKSKGVASSNTLEKSNLIPLSLKATIPIKRNRCLIFYFNY